LATNPISIENSLSAEIGQVTNFRELKLDQWPILVMEIRSLNQPLEKKSIESANRFGKAAGRKIVTWFGVDFVAVRTYEVFLFDVVKVVLLFVVVASKLFPESRRPSVGVVKTFSLRH
jgi:hypothetical protein